MGGYFDDHDKAIQDIHMNVKMDIAASKNNWEIYFRFGEVF
jgi:hypothetical protein